MIDAVCMGIKISHAVLSTAVHISLIVYSGDLATMIDAVTGIIPFIPQMFPYMCTMCARVNVSPRKPHPSSVRDGPWRLLPGSE